MTPLFLTWFSLILFISGMPLGFAESYTNEVESDVRYKRQLPIYLQHDFGEVSIQGWNQDLIRVKLKKTVNAESELSAQDLFRSFDLVSLETPTAIELRVGTPQGTDLLTKLKNRQQRKNIQVDLEIKAPIALPLTVVLGNEKKLKINQWRGKINLTGSNNEIDLSKLRSSQAMNVSCPDCSIIIKDSEFSGSVLAGNRKVDLQKVDASGGPIQVFTKAGEVSLSKTKGDFLIRTESASVTSVFHAGGLHLQSESGKFQLDGFEGDLDAQSSSGDIRIEAIRVPRSLELKSKSGSFEMLLPRDFSGYFDLQTIQGEAQCEFSLSEDREKRNGEYGPKIKGLIAGYAGKDGKAMVTALSESGSIRVKRKEVQK